MVRYLVTGASGFIGRAVVAELLAEAGGADATAQNDVEVGVLLRRPPSERVEDRRVEPIIVPEPTADHLKAVLGARPPPDIVLHLAGAGVAPETRAPLTMIDTNVALVARVIEALPGPVRFVYAGTCAEYGRVAEGVKVTENAPIAPIEGYGATKAGGAHVGRVMVEAAGGRFIHARAFGVYGPGEAAYRLIPYLASQLRAGRPVDLTPGAQVRDFMFVDDCARALIALGRAPAGPDVFNVCTGIPVSVADIARLTARALGAPEHLLRLGARPYRSGESMWMVGDPQRLASLGFAPKFALEAGIDRMLSAPGQAP